MPLEEGRPATSTYIYFRGLANVHKRLRLVHQLDRGEVRIQIEGLGDRVAHLAGVLGPYLEADMKVDRANKSARVYIRVPTVDAKRPFGQQLEAVAAGAEAALRLLAWARIHYPRMGLGVP
jgi:hypothetical protein